MRDRELHSSETFNGIKMGSQYRCFVIKLNGERKFMLTSKLKSMASSSIAVHDSMCF